MYSVFMLLISAVTKAWKTLENEEGYKRCQEIIEEARTRTEDLVSIKNTSPVV